MQKSSNPFISLIIATKNEAVNLPVLFATLKLQSLQNFETIIVDNHSDDASFSIAKRYTIKAFTKGRERSEQRNFGVSKSQGSILLFLDADMELTPHVLKECVDGLQNAGALIIPEDVKITNFFSRVKQLEKTIYQNEPLIEAARCFNRELFLKVGGYNTDLIAGEDWDLTLRIQKIARIGRIKSIIYHNENSLIRNLKHKWYYSKSIKKYKMIHPTVFFQQISIYRIKIFLTNYKLLLKEPFVGTALILIKLIEYLLYKFRVLIIALCHA